MSNEKYRFQFRKDGVPVKQECRYTIGYNGRIWDDDLDGNAPPSITAHLFIKTLDGEDVYAGDTLINENGLTGVLRSNHRVYSSGAILAITDYSCWRLHKEPSERERFDKAILVLHNWYNLAKREESKTINDAIETISMIARDIDDKKEASNE